MKVGDIFFFPTEKARGHKVRDKYHVFICAGTWADDNVFLFISKADPFNVGLKIKKEDGYDFLEYEVSYIAAEPVFYSDTELEEINIGKPVCRIKDEHFKDLHNHVLNSEVMEPRHIRAICNALRKFIQDTHP